MNQEFIEWLNKQTFDLVSGGWKIVVGVKINKYIIKNNYWNWKEVTGEIEW
jgi:hypothetical protein